MRHSKILFVTKKNSTYGFTNYCRRNSGLWVSTSYVVKALRKRGIHADLVEVTDNNDIDREVTKHRPHIVVIEALWVVPEKFDVLKSLHPNVRWYCHLHSNIPFLAGEGVAVAWLREYADRGVGILSNSEAAVESLRTFLPCETEIHYLPNIYERELLPMQDHPRKHTVNVGCFGAVRPMKNQLIQAVAALQFARSQGKYLLFHINGARVEQGGDQCLKNLRAFFSSQDEGELVEHPWYEPADFMKVLRHDIDIGLQVSLSETFNIVAADYVAAGLPIVVSREVPWASSLSHADTDRASSICRAMKRAWGSHLLVHWNQHCLESYSRKSVGLWSEFARCK